MGLVTNVAGRIVSRGTAFALVVGAVAACSAAPPPDESTREESAAWTGWPICTDPPVFDTTNRPAPGITHPPVNARGSVAQGGFVMNDDEIALQIMGCSLTDWGIEFTAPANVHDVMHSQRFILCPAHDDVKAWITAHAGENSAGAFLAHKNVDAWDQFLGMAPSHLSCWPFQLVHDAYYVFWNWEEIPPNCLGGCPVPPGPPPPVDVW